MSKGCLGAINRFIFLLIFLFNLNLFSQAADLDDIYKPLLREGRYFYEASFDYFKLKDRGVHGDIANDYEDFKANPYLFSLYNSLTISPKSFLNLKLGFKQTGPLNYTRSTSLSTGVLAVDQDYDLDYFHDYNLSLRARGESAEFYLETLGKRQKTSWYSNVYIPPPSWVSSYASTYFMDIRLGVRYLSSGFRDNNSSKSLDLLILPLLENKQFNLETELGFKRGKLKGR